MALQLAFCFFGVATAQRWLVPISHEHHKPTVDTSVLGNLKETKVLEKTLGSKYIR